MVGISRILLEPFSDIELEGSMMGHGKIVRRSFTKELENNGSFSLLDKILWFSICLAETCFFADGVIIQEKCN